jgi:hypothetical protein
MIYFQDITEQGKKCEITIKGETLICQVVSAFEIIKKNGSKKRWYSIESKDKRIFDYVPVDDIKFKK